jgi:hypothetical protein
LIENRYDYRDWVVLKIDLKDSRIYKEHNIATQYRIFDDPKSIGVFTYENIDPYYIKLPPVAEITISDSDDFESIRKDV